MSAKVFSALTVLSLVGCATVEVPPERVAWARSVREEIAAANETNYVYVRVANKEEMKIVEKLAFEGRKETQRVERNGEMMECVFVFGRERSLRTELLPK